MTHPPLGKKTKGRQRRENRLVEDRESRQVTFSKRKSGLWKKASELALLCRASLAVVVFSEAGKGFTFGSPSTDAVLAYAGYGDADVHAAAAADDVEWEALEALCRETDKKGVEVAAEAARMSAVGKKVVDVQTQAGRRFWWEADVEALAEAELPEFARALQRLRDNVRRRARQSDVCSTAAVVQDARRVIAADVKLSQPARDVGDRRVLPMDGGSIWKKKKM